MQDASYVEQVATTLLQVATLSIGLWAGVCLAWWLGTDRD